MILLFTLPAQCPGFDIFPKINSPPQTVIIQLEII